MIQKPEVSFGKKETYKQFYDNREEIEAILSVFDGEILWDELDIDKKSRMFTLRRNVSFDKDDLSEIYEWMVNAMFAFRNIVVQTL